MEGRLACVRRARLRPERRFGDLAVRAVEDRRGDALSGARVDAEVHAAGGGHGGHGDRASLDAARGVRGLRAGGDSHPAVSTQRSDPHRTAPERALRYSLSSSLSVDMRIVAGVPLQSAAPSEASPVP